MAKASEGTNLKDCSLCQENEVTNIAITWCIDCETFLCLDCNKYHGRFKAFKDHNTTSIDCYNELPSFITQTKNHCPEHNKQLEVYCSFHSEVCCLDCITGTHSECNGFRKIEDVLSDFRSSSSVYHAESNLDDLSENFEKVINHVTKLSADVDTQKENGIQEIKSKKRLIIDHLDNTSKCLIDDVEMKHSEIKSTIENFKFEIERKQSEIHKTKRDFAKMKEFATGIQMYEGIKVIEKLTIEKTKYLEEMERKGALNETRLEIKWSPFLNSITSDLVCFGDASMLPTNGSLVLKLSKGEQVNINDSHKKRIDEIQPKLLKTIKILDGDDLNVTGCQILPDGQMVFVEQNRQCLLLYDKDGVFVRIVTTFPEAPYDVTFIQKSIVAVTTYNDNRVNFVNIDDNKIINSRKVVRDCYGITRDNDMIWIKSADENSIINLDLDGKLKPSLQKKSYSTHIASFENLIYVSEWKESKISCYKNNGDLLWTRQLDRNCQPRGLSVDGHGNIHVACNGSNSVIIVSADGKRHRTILKESDDLHYPFALDIDRKTSTCLICNQYKSSAFLFQI